MFHTEKPKDSSFGKDNSSDSEEDLTVLRGVRDQGMCCEETSNGVEERSCVCRLD